MTTWFSVNNGRLRIERDDSVVAWEGMPDGMRVLDIIPCPEAAIVLLDPPTGHASIRNLVKIDPEGSVLWRGELPRSEDGDCFVSVAMVDSAFLVASTWSGYRVHLSAETGELVGQEFTK